MRVFKKKLVTFLKDVQKEQLLLIKDCDRIILKFSWQISEWRSTLNLLLKDKLHFRYWQLPEKALD